LCFFYGELSFHIPSRMLMKTAILNIVDHPHQSLSITMKERDLTPESIELVRNWKKIDTSLFWKQWS